MGTKATPEPSWIDRLRSSSTTWLSAVAVTLGLGGVVATTKPSASPPLASPARAIVPKDPVSPNGHYATFSAYLESVDCKLQRGGYAPIINPLCSPFAAVAKQNAVSLVSIEPTSPLPSPHIIADQKSPTLSEKINHAFNVQLAIARGSDPQKAYVAYNEIEKIFIEAQKKLPPTELQRLIHHTGGMDHFYFEYDGVARIRQEDLESTIITITSSTSDPKNMTIEQKCSINTHLNDLEDVTKNRKSMRDHLKILDELRFPLDKKIRSLRLTRNQFNLYDLNCP